MKKNKSQADVEWEERTLCADESCIGVIGPDGHCKECGKPFESEQSEIIAEHTAENESQAAETESKTSEEVLIKEKAVKGKSQADIEWEKRTLCLDESCIGVIGTDGRCKECGKPYKTA